MKKITKAQFICDYCNRKFDNIKKCSSHELVCKILTEDRNRLVGYILTLINCYHRKGYTIDIRYSDKYSNDLIVDIKNNPSFTKDRFYE